MPAPSELVEGYLYPHIRPLLLDHAASSPVVRVNEIAIAFVAVSPLMDPHRPHRHHRPPRNIS